MKRNADQFKELKGINKVNGNLKLKEGSLYENKEDKKSYFSSKMTPSVATETQRQTLKLWHATFKQKEKSPGGPVAQQLKFDGHKTAKRISKVVLPDHKPGVNIESKVSQYVNGAGVSGLNIISTVKDLNKSLYIQS